MKDKDKLWLEFKVNVARIDDADVPIVLEDISKHVVSKDGSVQTIIVPVRDEESDVRLVYDPKGKHNKHQLNLAKKYMELRIKELTEKYGNGVA